MFRIAVAMALAACVGLVTLAAQRIVTSPPEPILKYLFPNAAAFSSLTGTPLHFKAYGADPKADPKTPTVGLAFWTTDVVPEEHGYHGPIHIMIGMDMTGVLTRVFVDYNTEPYGYFSVEPPEFADQFTGKSIRDPFRVGQDVHAVSRATITISSGARAIRDSARIMAKAHLDPSKAPLQANEHAGRGSASLGGSVFLPRSAGRAVLTGEHSTHVPRIQAVKTASRVQ